MVNPQNVEKLFDRVLNFSLHFPALSVAEFERLVAQAHSGQRSRGSLSGRIHG